MDEKIIEDSMAIIMAAGDARLACKEALVAAENWDFELADAKLKVAHKEIVKAHKVQTDSIQCETRGERKEFSLLFAHAQDTLMTIYAEINLAKHLIAISKSVDARIRDLEGVK